MRNFQLWNRHLQGVLPRSGLNKPFPYRGGPSLGAGAVDPDGTAFKSSVPSTRFWCGRYAF